MANISSLSGTTNSAMSSLRGYGGLASGLDRDELIAGMTSGTQTKITKQQQAKTKLQWQQQAYRDISDKMIAFANKYTSTMSSGTNLFSDTFWGAASTIVKGANSKFISVAGSNRTAAANVSILGVKQMAKNATLAMDRTVSDRKVETGEISTEPVDVNALGGKNLQFKIGGTSYSVSLSYGDGTPYKTANEAAEAINKAMEKVEVKVAGKTMALSDFVKVSGENSKDGAFTFSLGDKTEGNEVKLVGGTALSAMGFKIEGKDKDAEKDDPGVIEKDGYVLSEGPKTGMASKLSDNLSFAQRMGGKSLTFSYNGTAKSIDLPSLGKMYQYASGKDIVDKNGYLIDEDGYRFDKDGRRINSDGYLIDENGDKIKDGNNNYIKGQAVRFGKVDEETGNILDSEGKVVNGTDGQPLKAEERSNSLEYVRKALQDSLDATFGKGRIEVKLEPEKANNQKQHLSFSTVTPGGEADETSTFSIIGGSTSLMAKTGGMGIIAGESNRLNMNTSLLNSGLKGVATGTYEMEINGEKFSFTEKDSITSILNKINNSNAGVKVSYMTMADKFVIESTEAGAAGKIELSGNGADLLFGTKEATDGDGGYKVTDGQDAIVAVKYAGSDQVIELNRGSNSFSIDGLDVTVKGEFGYKEKVDEDGNVVKDENGKVELERDATTEAVTFETNVSSEKMVTAISDMVKEYNEILELVNSHVSTRPDRDYFPLTDDQKKEMSESEIKLWEEKAKAGILFGSSELRGLADDLRWAILPKDQQAMEAMGISVSGSWQDNGKLSFDETKFKAALEKNPDAVKEAFTAADGIASNLKNTMDKYVKTMGATKGILIEKAGSTHAPTSVTSNALQSEIDDVDKILKNLQERLKSEQDRYISQFTQLETLISQMNSQSSYLSGMGF